MSWPTFAQFGTADLDRATRAQLERGQRSTEILKQAQYQPMSLDKETMILYAANAGDLDDVPLDRCLEFQEGFLRYMETAHPDIGSAIVETSDLQEKTEEALKAAIQEFKADGSARKRRRVNRVMPSLRQIKRRIRSIENTGKVTKAMELIAASRMRRDSGQCAGREALF